MIKFPRIISPSRCLLKEFHSINPRLLHQDVKEEKKTHFGFQTVTESEKNEKVHQLFNDVAESYDQMNDVLSFGLHRIWKTTLMHRLNPTENTKLLDVAGGTGDISFAFLDYIHNEKVEKGCHVTVCDINSHMLEVGKRRSQHLKHNPELINWIEGNAEQLPFPDESFSAYTIAFGIRNCTHIEKTLSEAYRVLKPGGRYLCLEFSQVTCPNFQWMYDQYSFNFVPVIAHLVTGNWNAYQYLVESIRKFPPKGEFKGMIENVGFKEVTYEDLTLGAVSIHSGFKL